MSQTEGDTHVANDAPSTTHDDSEHSAKIKISEGHRQEGNALLSAGDFGGACRKYDEGLRALPTDTEDEQTKHERLALHLNACLAHLKRGNLATAIDHGSDALELDKNNVKALYRRGLARKRLSEQPEHRDEAQLAQDDLELALKLEPQNGDVRMHVQQLRAVARSEQKEKAKVERESQKETFKGLFERGKPLYTDPVPVSHPPEVRDDGGSNCNVLIAARDVQFYYQRGEPVLSGCNLELRAGWCTGLFGNNATGKTTLARLLTGKLSPTGGAIKHTDSKANFRDAASQATRQASRYTFGVTSVLVAICAIVCQSPLIGRFARTLEAIHFIVIAVVLGVLVVLVIYLALQLILTRRAERGAQCTVLHVSSETLDKENIPETKTIERVISEVMSGDDTTEQKRTRVIALLKASGFQMFNQTTGEPIGSPEEYVRDGLKYGNLSGGQKHLIYVLRSFARRPDVMLCDELLGGLDAYKQPRVLHMLKRLIQSGMAVLFITTELHQIRLVADGLGYMADGKIVELGPADDVLEFPKHPATKEYLNAFRSLPGGHILGGKLAESYTALKGNPDFDGPWMPLPPKR